VNFRLRYFELYILRTQLSLEILYLELIVILDSKALKIVRFIDNFENCRIFKTSINRFEINAHIVFLKENQN